MNGGEIKRRREKAGLTQQQLAEKLCCDRSTVAKWETNESAPRTHMLPALAKLLKCRIEALY